MALFRAHSQNDILRGMWEAVKRAPLTCILCAINIIIFIIYEIIGDTYDGYFMLAHGAMSPVTVVYDHEWYRLLSSCFLHFGFEHIASNMLLLFLLGQIFEEAVGPVRYLGIYLASGISSSFLSLVYSFLRGTDDVSAGASGAIFGLVGGMIVIILVHKGHYHNITIRRMLFMAFITLAIGFSSANTNNVGHIGGLIAGFVLTWIFYGLPFLLGKAREKRGKLANDQQ